ncbi:hypothetical protein [Spirosoma sp. KNUC1025]|uniref:hypothetical protein n=1 Tax=Spirosoma sp. KNUC1025 TaxID=2894082 RepID=UPI001E4909BC|nr:hypothetical protein [Spirosoma sp. KNUC1025]UFH57529.1 hypothetical protein LN737_30975 [Spirosoma sp. KNUC1025]
MTTNLLFSVLLKTLFAAGMGFGQPSKPPKDYLGVPGPIRFADNAYQLAWTAHPSATFYKQEYIAAGDKPEQFKTMLLVDVITNPVELRDVVRTKTDELQRLKQQNPLVSYEVFERNGEYLLDFLLSQNTPDGKRIRIVERNVYRYKTVVTKSGQPAVLLFGVSTRGYDGEVTPFLAALKANRSIMLRQFSQVSLPQIAIVH